MADVSSIDWLKIKRDYLSDTEANLRTIAEARLYFRAP